MYSAEKPTPVQRDLHPMHVMKRMGVASDRRIMLTGEPTLVNLTGHTLPLKTASGVVFQYASAGNTWVGTHTTKPDALLQTCSLEQMRKMRAWLSDVTTTNYPADIPDEELRPECMMPVAEPFYGYEVKLHGLPDPQPNHFYVVDLLVFLEATAEPGDWRQDVLTPDYGLSAERDDDGKLLAVTQLIGHNLQFGVTPWLIEPKAGEYDAN